MEVVLVLAGLVVGLAVGLVVAGRRRRPEAVSAVDDAQETPSPGEPIPPPGQAAGGLLEDKKVRPSKPGGTDDEEEEQPGQEELQQQELERLRETVETSGARVEDLESRVRRYRRWASIQMTRMSEEIEQVWKAEKLPVHVHQMANAEAAAASLEKVRRLAQPLQSSMDDLGTDAPEVYHRLGMWHALEGRAPQAAGAFEGAVRNGMGARAWLALGDSLWTLDRRKKARDAYQQCLNLDKRVPLEILRRCAQVAYEQRNYSEALSLLKPLFGRKQTPVEVFTLASRAAAKMGDHEGAISVCEAGLKHHGDSAVLLAAMIVPLAELGEAERAEETYIAAREIDPELADAPLAMGIVHLQADAHDDAVAHLEEALELDGSSAEAQFHLGVIHNRKNEYRAALEHFGQAVELKPDYAEAYYNMKDAYDGLRDYENSIAVLKRAVQLNPEYE